MVKVRVKSSNRALAGVTGARNLSRYWRSLVWWQMRSSDRLFDPVGEILKPFVTGPNSILISHRGEEDVSRKSRCRTEKSAKNWLAVYSPRIPGLEIVHPDAAGIDVGNQAHYVAVRPDRDAEPVRRFECFTADLYRLVAWLKKCRVKTIVLQSTGVYWIPLYDIMEEQGFEVYLVNARRTKSLPEPQKRCTGKSVAAEVAHLRVAE